jgi:hypothetical protein
LAYDSSGTKTFKAYLVIEQYTVQVEYFTKLADGSWNLKLYTSADNIIEGEPLGIELPVARLYSKVKFPEKPKSVPAKSLSVTPNRLNNFLKTAN